MIAEVERRGSISVYQMVDGKIDRVRCFLLIRITINTITDSIGTIVGVTIGITVCNLSAEYIGVGIHNNETRDKFE